MAKRTKNNPIGTEASKNQYQPSRIEGHSTVSDPEEIRKRRLRGKVLLPVSAIAFIVATVLYCIALGNTMAIPDSVSPMKAYPNPYTVDYSSEGYIFLVIFAVWGTLLGFMLMRKPEIRRSHLPWTGAVVIAALFALVGHSIQAPVSDNLLANQKSWAEQRYGISYDEISTFETKAGRYGHRTWQNELIKDGKPVAEVCGEKTYISEIRFCTPGTLQELKVIST